MESEELGELAADSGATDIPSSGEGQIVARLDPESSVRRGEEVDLWVDATKLYFFHPEEGGRNLAEEVAAAYSRWSRGKSRLAADDSSPFEVEHSRPDEPRTKLASP